MLLYSSHHNEMEERNLSGNHRTNPRFTRHIAVVEFLLPNAIYAFVYL